MSAFTKGMEEGATEAKGVMEQVNKVGDNLTGAMNEMGADAAAQGEKAKARWGAIRGNLAGTMANMQGKITDMGTAAQAEMAKNAAAKAGKSAEDLFSEVVPDPVGLVASLPGKLADGTNALVEGYDDQSKKFNAGKEAGIKAQQERIAAQKAAKAAQQQSTGGRRRRRRRTRRKKRRKSRKSRRRRRKSRKKFKKHYMWNKKGKRYRVKTYKQHIKGVRLGHTHKKPKKTRRRRRR